MNEPKNIEEAHPHSDKAALAERLAQIGIALSLEKDPAKLLEVILLEAKFIARADGGTLYFLNENDVLEYEIVRTDSLSIAFGGVGNEKPPFEEIPLYHPDGSPNMTKQVVNAILNKRSISIDNAYESDEYDFKGTRAFDQANDYTTRSVLTVPMLNHKNEAIGCLQLVNALDPETGETTIFNEEAQQIVQALASQAAVILDNKILIEAQSNLLESFIKIIAEAIDAKSDYTGNHCAHVPVLTEMLAAEACEVEEGRFARFSLTDEEKYELHIAAWLHDCGKIVTPPHIMDKGTKLETIHDRIFEVLTRIEVLRRDAKIRYLEATLKEEGDEAAALEQYRLDMERLDRDEVFLKAINQGSEYMDDNDIDNIGRISRYEIEICGETQRFLSDDEVMNLSIRKGTINRDERQEMNDHMVHTVNMLEAMPWPRHLRRVPEYACGHHEKMDGTGYPRGILAGTMSVPARMMAVADVFEALTAKDRPYKPAKKLSEAMDIIGKFKKNNHLDPDVVDFFVTSGVYRRYAEMYLDKELIDIVDEQAILDIVPDEMVTRRPRGMKD